MTKRGISPLIASVLLIAFTIILFATITLWIRNSAVNPAMQETEDKVASDLEAMGTRIEIENAELNGNNIKLSVDNIGSTLIKGFSVRVIGVNGVDIIQVEQELKELDSVTKDINFNISKTGNLEKIEIIPILASGLAISATTSETGIKGGNLIGSLVAYYAFEGNANDLSGNGNNGVIYGADCNVNGRIGKACSFDGVDDYVLSTSVISVPSNFTAVVWFKRSGNSGGLTAGLNEYHYILGAFNGAYRNRLLVSSYGDELTAGVHDGAYKTNILTISNPNIWHQIGIIWDGSKVYAILDGVISPTGTASGAIASGTTKILIGRQSAGTYVANGSIDEVMIFNRALSEDEVKALAA